MKRKRLKGDSPEEIGNGSIIPKKGVFHDPLNDITPEMYEAAKPKLKGVDFVAPDNVGTSGSSCPTKDMLGKPIGYTVDFSTDNTNWKDKPKKLTTNCIHFCSEKGKKFIENYGMTMKDLEEAAIYIHKISFPKIDLIIYQAEGYFVGEYVMEGRSGKTKAGWKGIKELVERYSSSDFKVTYNGVKYEVEGNKKLFKKLFDEI